MFTVIFHPAVENEIIKSIEWYNSISNVLAQKYKMFLHNSFLQIKLNPFSNQISYSNIRIYNLRKFPYQIIYSIENNKIFVYSLFHKSRNPNIWKNRKF